MTLFGFPVIVVARLPLYEIVAGQCLTVVQVDDPTLYDALGNRCVERLEAIAERWGR